MFPKSLGSDCGEGRRAMRGERGSGRGKIR